MSVLCASAEENAPGTTGVLEALVGGKRTLVLADGPQIQDSHSMFFAALKVCFAAVVCVCIMPCHVAICSYREDPCDTCRS